MQFDWQTYTEQLAQAVEAEIQFQYEEKKNKRHFHKMNCAN